MNILPSIGAVLILLGVNGLSQGIILWDESVNGPFSQDFSVPTSLTPLQAGTNSIIGQTEVVPTGPNWAGHPDFFTITVLNNSTVAAVYLSVDKPNVWTWIGNPGFSSQIAFVQSPVSGELLSQWGLLSVSAGNYGMYLNNHDQQAFTSVAIYRLDFVVQSIPEPSSLALLGVGLVFIGLQRCNKRL